MQTPNSNKYNRSTKSLSFKLRYIRTYLFINSTEKCKGRRPDLQIKEEEGVVQFDKKKII